MKSVGALPAGQPGKRPSDFRDAWEVLKQEAAELEADTTCRDLAAAHPKVVAKEAAVDALSDRKDDLARMVWMAKAQDLDDVYLLAEIAWDQWWGVGFFPRVPDDIDDRTLREVSVAYLVRGIADFANARDDDDLEEMLSQARQGLTTLRAALQGWRRQHGPQNGFSDADVDLIASVEFCANGIEALLDRELDRLADPEEAP